MILDRGHRGWALFSAAFLAASATVYGAYAAEAPGGPAGGSATGIAFGVAAALLVLFAALLGVRKRRPHYRLGRASSWLKGHLWLGALSLPLALFHGGFALGGALTSVLMALFLLVWATGAWGLALQQFLPRLVTENLPQETVYEQIDHVREVLLAEAAALASGTGGRAGAVPKAKSGGAIQGRVVQSRAVETAEEGAPERAPLVRFVDVHMRPFFEARGARRAALFDPHRRAALFGELRRLLDPKLHPVADDLLALCVQREELEVQRRLHHWLHGWLLVHVPLAWALVVLAAVHAVVALSY